MATMTTAEITTRVNAAFETADDFSLALMALGPSVAIARLGARIAVKQAEANAASVQAQAEIEALRAELAAAEAARDAALGGNGG